jgi:hypothetical protein
MNGCEEGPCDKDRGVGSRRVEVGGGEPAARGQMADGSSGTKIGDMFGSQYSPSALGLNPSATSISPFTTHATPSTHRGVPSAHLGAMIPRAPRGCGAARSKQASRQAVNMPPHTPASLQRWERIAGCLLYSMYCISAGRAPPPAAPFFRPRALHHR